MFYRHLLDFKGAIQYSFAYSQCVLSKDVIKKETAMYEIIANPEDYQIDDLINGTGNAYMEISQEDRDKWAAEIINFSERLTRFAKRSQTLAEVFKGSDSISSTPASLKTLKIQLFAINDALSSALEIADRLEADIIKK